MACMLTDGIVGMTSMTDRVGVNLIEPDLLPNLPLRIGETCKTLLAPRYSRFYPSLTVFLGLGHGESALESPQPR